MADSSQIIVVGGGLSGLSACHTILENGGRVLLVDKNSFLGGNSTKATSGINGSGTKTQNTLGIKDTNQSFYDDTAKSAKEGLRPGLVKVLTGESAPAVDWLQDRFGLDLSLVSRLGGHSFPRTHRGKERFPGMTITYALMEKLEEITKATPQKAKILIKSKVVNLLTEGSAVVGVEIEKDGQKTKEYGPVIIATGGYGADFGPDSLLRKWRPDICHLATTNGDHCTGDGIKMAQSIGANCVDMKNVQVHPTGLVDLNEPDAKVKFLAAEALRGVGGLLLTADGLRFCDELGTRDYVTGEMWKNKGPFRLVLNSKGSKEIEWHCKHYCGRGLMKKFANGADLAKDIGISPEVLADTFKKYNGHAEKKDDPYQKKFFAHVPFSMDDEFHVSIVTPVVHYCMGGLEIDPESAVIGTNGPIAGLWAAGEVMGGVHGINRLGGSSLLDCVVFGRVAGASAVRFLKSNPGRAAPSTSTSTSASSGSLTGQSNAGGPVSTHVEVHPAQNRVRIVISWGNNQREVVVPTAAKL